MLVRSGLQTMCTKEEMDGAILFFPTSPVFLFILIIGVFLSGGNVALESILRSRKKVPDLLLVE